ncbi:MAG: TatD family hydrolase [Acidobacteriota bacterium]
MFIDSHAHIDFTGYDEDRDEVIARARTAGVDIIVDIGNGDLLTGSHEKAQALADRYPFIYTTVGVHPHDAKLLDDTLVARLLGFAQHPKVIAWGEIGLDYYYDNSPREIQRKAFQRQLELACTCRLPVIIHTRDAEEDTLQILREHWADTGLGGILHCYTGSYQLALAGLAMGFLVSFSGVLTFKKSSALREVARRLPLDCLLIETDCPYLSPEPFRGKRNEPAQVREVARQLAELHNLSIEAVAQVTSDNFRRFFNLPALS